MARSFMLLLTAGALASPLSGGDFVVGPPYQVDPALLPQGRPRGRFFNFTMPLTDSSSIFNGSDINPDCHGPAPGECCHKPSACELNAKRRIHVYVPAAYKDGDAAPIMIMNDGPGYLDDASMALDNLVEPQADEERRLPAFIAIAVQNGGSDAIKSERGLEYDTMSDRFSNFLSGEVLPAVLANGELRAAFPHLRFTEDPDQRAVFGCSSGGAAALTAAWFRPDLFKRVAAYSATLVDQQDHDDATGARGAFPFGAWEYHSATRLIATTPRKPLRIFTHCSEFDLGYDTRVAAIDETGGGDVNNTDGDVGLHWTDGHHNWRVAGNRTATALKAAGYAYRHVFAEAAQHCDAQAIRQTLADTLVWLWQDEPVLA